MILDNSSKIKSIIGFQFHFGVYVNNYDSINRCSTCVFSDDASGCYNSTTNTICNCSNLKNKSFLLSTYKSKIEQRIEPLYRTDKDIIYIELIPFQIKELSIQYINIKLHNNEKIYAYINIQKIGIGTITLWIDGFVPENEHIWRKLRNPNKISFLYEENNMDVKWNIAKYIRYLAFKCNANMNKKNKNHDVYKVIDNDYTYVNYVNKVFSKYSKNKLPISCEFDYYPFFYIQFDFKTNILKKKLKQSPKDIRLLLYGDHNWSIKNDKVIKESVLSQDVSTRESVIWYMLPDSMLKLASNEIENSIYESLIIALLEVDIILTIRYFLMTITKQINILSKKKLYPSHLAEIKNQLYENLEKYYHVELSRYALGRDRLERLKETFHINILYKDVLNKFDILSMKVSDRNSIGMERQQILLTLVFGFFGAHNTISKLLLNFNLNTNLNDLLSLLLAFLFDVLILLTARILRKK